MNGQILNSKSVPCSSTLAEMLEATAKLFDAYAERIKAVETAGVKAYGEQELKDILEELDPKGKLYEKVKRLLDEYQKTNLAIAPAASGCGCGCGCGGGAKPDANSELFFEAWDAMGRVGRILRRIAKGGISGAEIGRLERWLISWHPNTMVYKMLTKAIEQYKSEYKDAFGKPYDDTTVATTAGHSPSRPKV